MYHDYDSRGDADARYNPGRTAESGEENARGNGYRDYSEASRAEDQPYRDGKAGYAGAERDAGERGRDYDLKQGGRQDERERGYDYGGGSRMREAGRRDEGSRLDVADRDYQSGVPRDSQDDPRWRPYSPARREASREDWDPRRPDRAPRRQMPDDGRGGAPGYGRPADEGAGYRVGRSWSGGGAPSPRGEYDYAARDRGGEYNDMRGGPGKPVHPSDPYRYDDDYYSDRAERGDRRRGGGVAARGGDPRDYDYGDYAFGDRGGDPPAPFRGRAPSLPRGDPRYPDPRFDWARLPCLLLCVACVCSDSGGQAERRVPPLTQRVLTWRHSPRDAAKAIESASSCGI